MGRLLGSLLVLAAVAAGVAGVDVLPTQDAKMADVIWSMGASR
ncbi:hypothetical protein [Micromonospora thermarum]|nr:hypothetical protein [Micromonospora thermarum]